MPGFTVHQGKIAVYNQDHVDTDRIIPARFLTMVTKHGYGDLLFADAKKQDADFPLDDPSAEGASILVAGTNFGCGSSREHAVWAIQQAGFKCVIAKTEGNSPGYSDIFRQNSANCGLLLVELPASDHQVIAEAGSGAQISVDLPNQTITCGDSSIPFEINPATKDQLVQGLDLIGTTLLHEDKVTAYEAKSDSYAPSSTTN